MSDIKNMDTLKIKALRDLLTKNIPDEIKMAYINFLVMPSITIDYNYNINCTNCEACQFCMFCVGCYNCSYCKNTHHCVSCECCDLCDLCNGCKRCNSCTNCVSCNVSSNLTLVAEAGNQSPARHGTSIKTVKKCDTN